MAKVYATKANHAAYESGEVDEIYVSVERLDFEQVAMIVNEADIHESDGGCYLRKLRRNKRDKSGGVAIR